MPFLTYCLNIHPAESWQETAAVIRIWPDAVRRHLDLPAPMGLGLRLSDRAARELEEGGDIQRLQADLADRGLFAFTVNAFPFGAFHDARVKERVYAPDWSTDVRREYTLRVARLLAALLPDGVPGSISTVPVSYRAWMHDPGQLPAAVAQLCRTAVGLRDLEERTGRWVTLALEPEPGCLLETAEDCVTFWQNTLIPSGTRYLQETFAVPLHTAEQCIARYLGVCFDTCHFSVMYQDLTTSLRRIHKAGIAIPKIQLSAAPRIRPADGLPNFLDALRQSPYLHQVIVRHADRHTVYADLPAAEADAAAMHGDEWRVHCHVPLYLENAGPLATTAQNMDTAFFATAAAIGVPHYECETYTYSVLPGTMKEPDLAPSIARELHWAEAHIRAIADDCDTHLHRSPASGTFRT